jgi:reverse gyrase
MKVINTKVLLNNLLKIYSLLFVLFLTNSCSTTLRKEINSAFEKTKRIEILAYIDRNQWDEEDNSNYSKLNYIKNGNLEINKKYLKNRIILNEEQIEILKKRLSKCEIENWGAKCYNPRHAILFYDKNDKIYGYIEMCFDCNGSESSENFKAFSGCALGLKETLKEFGITYFNEGK